MEKAKLNIPMCAALVLLLLTLVSIHLTSGLYARYTVTATGSDSARVAKFDVSGNGAGHVSVDCQSVTNINDPAVVPYAITITNNSEVTVRCTITLVFDELIKGTDMYFTTDTGEASLKNDQKTLVLTAFNMTPETSASRTVYFHMTNWSTVSQNTTEPTATMKLNFKVNIDVQQVD